jgi:myosin-1
MQDEECLRPGDVSDETFLGRMDNIFARHKHYHSFGSAVNRDRRAHTRGTFQISHYAGDVVYTVEGFLDKNNDLLFRDMKEVVYTSQNPVAHALFPAEELQSLKRPPTAATQFKNSMNALIDILMKKTPWYVRCIKPNAGKKPVVFEDDLVRHQVCVCVCVCVSV